MKRLATVVLVLALVVPTFAAAATPAAPPRQPTVAEQLLRWIGNILHPVAAPKPPVHIDCAGSGASPDGNCI